MYARSQNYNRGFHRICQSWCSAAASRNASYIKVPHQSLKCGFTLASQAWPAISNLSHTFCLCDIIVNDCKTLYTALFMASKQTHTIHEQTDQYTLLRLICHHQSGRGTTQKDPSGPQVPGSHRGSAEREQQSCSFTTELSADFRVAKVLSQV